jgi:hypothetical protein
MRKGSEKKGEGQKWKAKERRNKLQLKGETWGIYKYDGEVSYCILDYDPV